MILAPIVEFWHVLSTIVGTAHLLLLMVYARRWLAMWHCYRILQRRGLADELLTDPKRTCEITSVVVQTLQALDAREQPAR